MPTFYFTYGSSGHPYYGGWTEIEAADIQTACKVFQGLHPNKRGDSLNCSCVYTEEQFKKTSMYADGNFGIRCHERIGVTIEYPQN